MKVCVFGAGAIGGYLAAHFARVPGAVVSVVARGAHLAAIKADGLRVESPKGVLTARVAATDRPADLGPQDLVVLALKSQQVTPALNNIQPLLGPTTAIVPPTTGIPYWYFHDLPGPWRNRQVDRLDPGGLQWRALPPGRVLGCVYWVASEVTRPGVIHHDGSLSRFPIGEPDGMTSDRLSRFADLFKASGLDAPIVPDIRAWIWAKMISSLSWNPIATLTLATLSELNARPELVAIVRRTMAEADALARALGVERMPISIDDRIAAARNAAGHKMSMLQDLERGRPLEIDVLESSIVAMKELVDSPTPTIDDMLALLRMRASKGVANHPAGREGGQQ
jgi:2-dehydropantoate 2-reductase